MLTIQYGIWQVTVMNGQQRPIAIPTFLVLSGEADTPTATRARAVAAATMRAVAMTASLSGHFYICRTES